MLCDDSHQDRPRVAGINGPNHLRLRGAISLLVFLIFRAAYRDRNYVGAAASSKLTVGTGDQDDAIALAPASNMTATDLDVSEITVPRHRCHRLAHSHTLKTHDWTPPFGR